VDVGPGGVRSYDIDGAGEALARLGLTVVIALEAVNDERQDED
jgi:hypothetical protein